MSRHAVQHYPKHVRRLVARLADAGYAAKVAVGRRGYLVSWRAAGETMRIGLGLSRPVGDSIERLWSTIRTMFRARGLEVPA